MPPLPPGLTRNPHAPRGSWWHAGCDDEDGVGGVVMKRGDDDGGVMEWRWGGSGSGVGGDGGAWGEWGSGS
ncbi:hypothetical protein Tco_0827358, partial [Tanacetum coccineum]